MTATRSALDLGTIIIDRGAQAPDAWVEAAPRRKVKLS